MKKYAEHHLRKVLVTALAGAFIVGLMACESGSHASKGATTGATRIGSNSKIDNLVQIGHNVEVGEQVLISGKVGISGSARIGDGAVLAGDSAAVDHATVGEGAILMARAVAMGEVAPRARVLGFPARDHRAELRTQAALRRLPDLLREVRELRRRLALLEGDSEPHRS